MALNPGNYVIKNPSASTVLKLTLVSDGIRNVQGVQQLNNPTNQQYNNLGMYLGVDSVGPKNGTKPIGSNRVCFWRPEKQIVYPGSSLVAELQGGDPANFMPIYYPVVSIDDIILDHFSDKDCDSSAAPEMEFHTARQLKVPEVASLHFWVPKSEMWLPEKPLI
ncbi:hypothetical protein B0J17DRAFT_630976 [Rhizoctonia solani]|nr:hypothetical protein B0J17DRAFT_630976 [Rhizoctonia solani]